MHTSAPSATTRVYQHLKRAILERIHAEGALLSEAEIAATVGVSRTPVREALLRLESEGLVALYPKRGVLVRPVSAEEIEDVIDARRLVEVHAAQRAWARREQLVGELDPLLAAMRAARDDADVPGLMAADRAFHEAVVAGGGNAIRTWGVGVFVYMVAVFHRTSLAVAGVTAAHRFGIGAAVLGLFSVAQLFMCAGMQIPVGLLLDRFGSRRMLMTGAALMAAGQLAFALAPDVRAAIVARLLIGTGDAMTFVSVLRLVALWLPARRNPIFVQLTGVLGQLGSVASAVPVVVLL